MGALKTVFRRIGGRIVPIRVSTKLMSGVQDEFVNILEVQRARKAAKFGDLDIMGYTFLKTTKIRAKKTGALVARRIARFGKKGIK